MIQNLEIGLPNRSLAVGYLGAVGAGVGDLPDRRLAYFVPDRLGPVPELALPRSIRSRGMAGHPDHGSALQAAHGTAAPRGNGVPDRRLSRL